MRTVRHTIEVDRSPGDVFALATDMARWPEWQEGLTHAAIQGAGKMRVGAHVLTTRKVGPRHVTMASELTTLDAPRAFAFRGIDGAVRGSGHATFEPLDNGSRTRMTLELGFEGRGIGKVLVPLLVRLQAPSQLRRSQEALKRLLERPTASATH